MMILVSNANVAALGFFMKWCPKPCDLKRNNSQIFTHIIVNKQKFAVQGCHFAFATIVNFLKAPIC